MSNNSTPRDKQSTTESSRPKRKYSKRRKEIIHEYPVVEPTVIQSFATPIHVENHSYRDFSQVPSDAGWKIQEDDNHMTFAEKVHHIIHDDESNHNSANIVWKPHGRAFVVLRPKGLEKAHLHKYFGHCRYSGFRTQLKRNGFKQLTVGEDRGCFYHECMLKGKLHLCQYMPTMPITRKKVPDPTNEPDLYAISQSFPLDIAARQGVVADRQGATPSIASSVAGVTLSSQQAPDGTSVDSKS